MGEGGGILEHSPKNTMELGLKYENRKFKRSLKELYHYLPKEFLLSKRILGMSVKFFRISALFTFPYILLKIELLLFPGFEMSKNNFEK